MKILKKLENVFAAAAFAEAGEFETAREMVNEDVTDSGYCDDSCRDNITEHPSKA